MRVHSAGVREPREAPSPPAARPSRDRLRPACCPGPAGPRRAPHACRTRKHLREVRGSPPRRAPLFPAAAECAASRRADGQQPGSAP